MLSDRYAALLPMDFALDRQEISVVYFSPYWDDVAELVKDPVAFLANAGTKWPQAIEPGPVEWTLLPPATIMFEWVGRSPVGLMRTLSAIQTMSAEGAQQIPAGTNFGSSSTTEMLDQLSDDGFMLLEFSLNTHTVTVRYHPPQPPKDPAPDVDQLADIKFTNASFVLLHNPDEEKQAAVSVHFDIGGPDERPAFLSEFLKDCVGACTRATDPGDGKVLTKATTAFYKEGEPIEFTNVEEIVQPTFSVDPIFPYPTVIVEMAPSIVLGGELREGEDPPPGCLVCIEVNGVWTNPQNPGDPSWPADVQVGSTIFKCYPVQR